MSGIPQQRKVTNQEQARIDEILTNTWCKALIVRVLLLWWLAALCLCMFIDPSRWLTLATANIPLMLPIIRHYFK